VFRLNNYNKKSTKACTLYRVNIHGLFKPKVGIIEIDYKNTCAISTLETYHLNFIANQSYPQKSLQSFKLYC